MKADHKHYVKTFLDEVSTTPEERAYRLVKQRLKEKIEKQDRDAKLSPCVCGRQPKIVDLGRHTSGHGESTATYKVQCECGLCGPTLSDWSPRDELVDVWNGIIGGINP